MPASGRNVWHISGLQDGQSDSCLYGPEFKIGDLYFQLQFHPPANARVKIPSARSQPSVLYLVLLAELGDVPAGLLSLKLRATFSIEEVGFKQRIEVKDSLLRWRGGFGPTDLQLEAAMSGLCAADALTIAVAVDILEVQTPRATVLRWPIDSFEVVRNGHVANPCRAGFHASLSRRLEICGWGERPLELRMDLHPSIDATGNIFVSLRLDRGSLPVEDLELRFELSIEELGYHATSQVLRGDARVWSRSLGVASLPTECSALFGHHGTLTLGLCVEALSCTLRRPSSSPVWTDFVSPDFRYLLLSAAGPSVAGHPEQLHGELSWSSFASVCSANVHALRSSLLSSGVPTERIDVADFSGEVAQPHPRQMLEDFFRRLDSTTKVVIYYSGHATKDGAWCFRWLPTGQKYPADVTVAPHELFQWNAQAQANRPRVPLEILVESQCAGSWCLAAKDAQLIGRVFAACAPSAHAWAAAHGSIFTSWIVGQGPEPSLTAKLFPGGPQVPWEYSRSGAVGPIKIFSTDRIGTAVAPPLSLSLACNGSTRPCSSLDAALPSMASPIGMSTPGSTPWSASQNRSVLTTPSPTGWGSQVSRPLSASAGRRRLAVSR